MRNLVWIPVLVFAAVVPVQGREIVVDLNGGGEFTEIQPAIAAAADGDTVLVKPGEYLITEPIDFNRLHDPNDPGSPAVKNIVLRSERGTDVTTIRMAAEPADLTRASVVIFENGETQSSVLEGFTITGGKGIYVGVFPQWLMGVGGGVVCRHMSSPTLADCAIVGNTALTLGGGVYCADDSTPSLTACTIARNGVSDYERRGVFLFGAGGGVYCTSSSPTLNNCRILENVAEGFRPPCFPPQCNGSGWDGMGGGVFCLDSSPTLVNCVVSTNSAEGSVGAFGGGSGRGGGVFSTGDSVPVFVNCVISGNEASGGTASLGPGTSSGGGLFCDENSRPVLTNCTVVGNAAWPVGTDPGWGAGVACRGESSLALTNCVIWHNHLAPPLEIRENSTAVVSYSCIEGPQPWPGDGNIKDAPLFFAKGTWDDAGSPEDSHDDIWIEGDFRLQPDSPCVDAGTSEGTPRFDIEGNERPCGGGIDIGAYESDCREPTRFRRGDANSDGRRNISDVTFTLLFVLGSGAEPPCHKSADSDDSGTLEVTDVVFLLHFLFLEGAAPPSPFPSCGPDPTVDQLSCEELARCF